MQVAGRITGGGLCGSSGDRRGCGPSRSLVKFTRSRGRPSAIFAVDRGGDWPASNLTCVARWFSAAALHRIRRRKGRERERAPADRAPQRAPRPTRSRLSRRHTRQRFRLSSAGRAPSFFNQVSSATCTPHGKVNPRFLRTAGRLHSARRAHFAKGDQPSVT
jgi:hypothetical protein